MFPIVEKSTQIDFFEHNENHTMIYKYMFAICQTVTTKPCKSIKFKKYTQTYKYKSRDPN